MLRVKKISFSPIFMGSILFDLPDCSATHPQAQQIGPSSRTTKCASNFE